MACLWQRVAVLLTQAAGVILYLLQETKMSLSALEDLLYHRSGLLGLSGFSGDVRMLMAKAKEALEVFVYRIVR